MELDARNFFAPGPENQKRNQFGFAVGAIVQYLSRILLTFDYERRLRKYGAAWGGVALEVDMVAGAPVVLAAEEVVEADLVEDGRRGEC